MWIIIGQRTKTERVPGGIETRRVCERCHESAVFYERRVRSTFELYFVELFDYRNQRVMACGACGALYATDEHGKPDKESVNSLEKALGELGQGVAKIGKEVEEVVGKGAAAAGPAFGRAGVAATSALGQASRSLKPVIEEAGSSLAGAVDWLADQIDPNARPGQKRKVRRRRHPDPEEADHGGEADQSAEAEPWPAQAASPSPGPSGAKKVRKKKATHEIDDEGDPYKRDLLDRFAALEAKMKAREGKGDR